MSRSGALKGFKVHRRTPLGVYRLTQVFPGAERLEPLQKILKFDSELEARMFLDGVKVEVTDSRASYMRVGEGDGRILINLNYLRRGPLKYIYLDLIHELTHVRQLMSGMDIYDRRYSYVDRPSEVEAYRNAVREARRLGMSDAEILDYLSVDWVGEEDLKRLAQKLGIKLARNARNP